MKRRLDTRRAARRSAAQWQELVKRFEREGQTRGRFCATHGWALSTFNVWRRKLRRAAAALEEVPEALFVELSEPPVTEMGAGSWEITIGNEPDRKSATPPTQVIARCDRHGTLGGKDTPLVGPLGRG